MRQNICIPCIETGSCAADGHIASFYKDSRWLRYDMSTFLGRSYTSHNRSFIAKDYLCFMTKQLRNVRREADRSASPTYSSTQCHVDQLQMVNYGRNSDELKLLPLYSLQKTAPSSTFLLHKICYIRLLPAVGCLQYQYDCGIRWDSTCTM